jgi:hypothetical protein
MLLGPRSSIFILRQAQDEGSELRILILSPSKDVGVLQQQIRTAAR